MINLATLVAFITWSERSPAQLQAYLHLQHNHHQQPVGRVDHVHPGEHFGRAQGLFVHQDIEAIQREHRLAQAGAIDGIQRHVLVEVDQQGIIASRQGTDVRHRQGETW